MEISGKRLKGAERTGAPPKIKVKLRLKKGAKRELESTGELKLRARITYWPTAGVPATKSRRLRLRAK